MRQRIELATIRQVEAISSHVVVFKLERPYRYLLDLLCLDPARIMSPASVRKWGAEVMYYPVGTGPFILSDWEPSRRTVLRANLAYHGGRPFLAGGSPDMPIIAQNKNGGSGESLSIR